MVLHGNIRDSFLKAAVPEQSGGNRFNEKIFVAEMNHDTSLSQMEMPHGYTGTSGSGSGF